MQRFDSEQEVTFSHSDIQHHLLKLNSPIACVRWAELRCCGNNGKGSWNARQQESGEPMNYAKRSLWFSSIDLQVYSIVAMWICCKCTATMCGSAACADLLCVIRQGHTILRTQVNQMAKKE